MRSEIVEKVEAAEAARLKDHQEWQLRMRAMSAGICPECGGMGKESIRFGGLFWMDSYSEFHCSMCNFVRSELLTD